MPNTASTQKVSKTNRGRNVLWIVLLGLLFTLVVWSERQGIYDWLRLQGYHPPTSVTQLASDDTLTAKARRDFYVNHPVIQDKALFAKACPSGTEQTVVLGCYQSDQAGIYILNVTDARLQGIQQVTAAHEFLHAAYERLSAKDKAQVNRELQDYFYHDLHDQAIIDTINSYKKTEPDQLVNEMHSIIGTEVGNLPQPLEAYYSRYFTSRSKIVSYYQAYESEFSSRQASIKRYDAELATLKTQITDMEASLVQQQAAINDQRQQLNSYRQNGNIAAYNAGVAPYNAAVDSYNAGVRSVQNLVNQYNSLVESRNAIALEEQQLVQAISSSTSQIKQ